MTRPRADALPETAVYRDTGCSLFPSCLRCPFPTCRYDQQCGTRSFTTQQRLHIVRLLKDDPLYTSQAIAQKLGVSRRQVFRYLRRIRDENHQPRPLRRPSS